VKVISKTTKPDVDKLLRALLDSMTGVVFVDDSQVTKCQVEKRFGSPERSVISVEPSPAPDMFLDDWQRL
jgi:Holliday junction resolvase RusA-like endonuclease